MSGKSLVDQVKHYQKDIEKCPNNSERMIRCIQRLYVLPIKVEHLQETGVGRSVNSLRKYKGEVGEAAKALVAKWKAMVAAEESSDEAQEISPLKPQEVKISAPTAPSPNVSSSLKNEQKADRYSSKEKSSSRNHSSDSKRHHSEDKSHDKESKSHNSTKHRDKSSDKNHSSSTKKSHNSLLNSNNQIAEKKDSSNKNQKSHYDNKHRPEPEESPPHKKHKKHHAHSRNHASTESPKEKQPVKSDSEDESSSSGESETSVISEKSHGLQSDREIDEGSENSNSANESDSSSSSDHRHRSKNKSSHHKYSDSHHRKEKSEIKHKELKDKSKDRDKSKDHCTNSNNKSDRHPSKKKNSPSYKELIKENERKVKKEKDEFVAPKSVSSQKNVKLETNEDGSIDSGSGASFADALLGMDSFSEPKKKKKTFSSSSTSTSSSSNHKSSKSTKSKSSNSSGHSNKNETNSSKSSSSSKPKTIDELVEPPELLSKKIKLEALDLDISSTLPEINLNYKPLPHIPESSRRPSKTMTEEAMFSIMTTKNQRTKVYSGNKVYQSTVPSLFSLCIQLLYDNIDAVEYTGGVPYNLLKPLLEKLNADQLYVLEHFNPYLIEDTDELWKFHCSKDFRSEKRQDLETWRELYLRCLEEREKKLKALTANITQSMAKSTPVRQAKLAYVDAVVKPPRNVARKQAKYGTGNSTPNSKNPNKQDIVSKAFVGGNTPGVSAKDVVPTPPPIARAAAHHPTPAVLKKKKAPLMQKAIQVMKSTRFKR